METINETLTENSSEQEDISLFAGPILLIFYCLIFIFGLIGTLKFELL